MTTFLTSYVDCIRHIESLVNPGPCQDKIVALVAWMFSLNAEIEGVPAVRCHVTNDPKDIRFFLRQHGKDHFALFKLQKRCAVLGVYTGHNKRGLPEHLVPDSGSKPWSIVKRESFEALPIDVLKADIRRAYGIRLGITEPRGTTRSEQHSPPERSILSPMSSTKPQVVSNDRPSHTVPRVSAAVASEVIRDLFVAAEALIAEECRHNTTEDLQRQYEIIRTRTWSRVELEPDIINCLLLQAASYSVVRRSLGVVYPEDMWRLDAIYGSTFFKRGDIPQAHYSDWEGIVLDWGRRLLGGTRPEVLQSLEDLVEALQAAHVRGRSDLSPKVPKPRLVLAMATALPKVRDQILSDPVHFLDQCDVLSQWNPRGAYDFATQFAEGIAGMGPALVTNFLKELGLLYYVKVDVHLSAFMDEIAFGRKLSARKQFILSWLLAREAGMAPFFLDKILYVGGKYLKPQLRQLFQNHRREYEHAVHELIAEIPSIGR